MKAIAQRTFLGTLAFSLFTAAALWATPVQAVPKEQEVAPNARLEDADGHALELKALKGKPVVIIYDDRSSAPSSEAFRKEFIKQLKSNAFGEVQLLLVANVSAYDFWPARGTVEDVVRKETKKQGTKIYLDWTGGLRSAFKFKNEVTSVVMVGKDGRVAFASEGVPQGKEQQRLVEMLRAQGGK
jgi:predicted transcriptional regulator